MKAILFAGAAVALIAQPAAADIRVMIHKWNPAATPPDALATVSTQDASVNAVLDEAWNATRGKACDSVKTDVTALVLHQFSDSAVPADQFFCDLGRASSVSTSLTGQELTMKLHMPNNKIRLKLVLRGFGRPDFFVEMPFTLDVTVKAVGGQSGYLLKATSVVPKLTANDVKLDGASVAGDIVLTGAKVAKINVSKMIRDQVNARAVHVSDDIIDGINKVLRVGAPASSAIASSRLWYRDGRLVVAVEPRISVQHGTISGAITAGASDPHSCDGVPVTVTSNGPGRLTDPFARVPVFAAGEVYHSEAKSGAAQPQAGGGVRCGFQIANVAIGTGPEAEVPHFGRTMQGKVAMVAPLSQAIRIPSSSVSFKMAWGIGGSGDFLERKVMQKETQYKPGGPVMTPTVDQVTKSLPGGRVEKKLKTKAPVIKNVPRRER